MPERSRALVLAGGGVAGIAWELGMIAGLAAAGVDVTDAELVVGTSAGSTVGAQITSGAALATLLETQLDPRSSELAAEVDLGALRATLTRLGGEAPDPKTALARIGEMALRTRTVDEATRRRVIEARLPVHTWPTRALVVTAVDAESGDFVRFDRHSGVSLIDAVAASCAVPGVWPPVSIGGRRYIDGGVRSLTNADVASGCSAALILVPMPLDGPPARQLDVECAALRPRAAVHVVQADSASLAAIGANPLDPARRPAAAAAGRMQAAAVADAVRAFWK